MEIFETYVLTLCCLMVLIFEFDIVNFNKVRRAQLDKSTLLASTMVSLVSFQIF